jgi:thioredoxin-related protein
LGVGAASFERAANQPQSETKPRLLSVATNNAGTKLNKASIMLGKSFLKVFWLNALVVLFLSSKGQETGINFESGLSWKEVQAKAKVENKFIFVDCYATWCGPCKYMDKNIFPVKAVGAFMDSNFISIRVQMDRTARDSKLIKDWYSAADSLQRKYKIDEYPSYLFFSPDGQPVHKITGMSQKPDEFVVRVKEALDPQQQYYTQTRDWRDHMQDTGYLFKALNAAANVESDEYLAIENVYIPQLKNPYTKENIVLFDRFLLSSKERAFSLFLENIQGIDQLMGKGYVEKGLSPIVFREETATIFNQEGKPVYWKRILKRLERDYPGLGPTLPKMAEIMFGYKIKDEMDEEIKADSLLPSGWGTIHHQLANRYPGSNFDLIFLQGKLDYYTHNGSGTDRAKAALVLVKRYGSVLGDRDANDLVWDDIFNVTGDKEILSEALQWMRVSVARVADQENFDTYANLLYKTGNIKEAIRWEDKAIALAIKNNAKPSEIEGFKITLEKINNHQRTWDDNTPVKGV